jgi:hypothetical protein
MTQDTFRGGCLCGSVQFEINGEPIRFYHCHCTRCRKATGTGHATNLFLQPASLKWLTGEELVRSFKIPEAKRFTNTFCGVCGSRLPRQAMGGDIVMVPAGSLDSETTIQPQARIFWDSRAAWCCGGDQLPVYSEYQPM